MKKKVHIRDIEGKLLYNHLWDESESNCLIFDSLNGCVDKLEVKRSHWQICEGWVDKENPTRQLMR